MDGRSCPFAQKTEQGAGRQPLYCLAGIHVVGEPRLSGSPASIGFLHPHALCKTDPGAASRVAPDSARRYGNRCRPGRGHSVSQRSGICSVRRGMRKRGAVSEPQAESDRARNSAQAAPAQRKLRVSSGHRSFRRQIARRSLAIRCEVAPRDVIVTAGALEAVHPPG